MTGFPPAEISYVRVRLGLPCGGECQDVILMAMQSSQRGWETLLLKDFHKYQNDYDCDTCWIKPFL